MHMHMHIQHTQFCHFRSLNHFVSISSEFTHYFSIQCRNSQNRIETPPLPTRQLYQISIETDINGLVLLLTEIAHPVEYMRFRVMTSCHHFLQTLYRFQQTCKKQFSECHFNAMIHLAKK